MVAQHLLFVLHACGEAQSYCARAALQAQASKSMLWVQAYVTCKERMFSADATLGECGVLGVKGLYCKTHLAVGCSSCCELGHTRSGMPEMGWYLPGMSCI
jgi:hypothetical protein